MLEMQNISLRILNQMCEVQKDFSQSTQVPGLKRTAQRARSPMGMSRLLFKGIGSTLKGIMAALDKSALDDEKMNSTTYLDMRVRILEKQVPMLLVCPPAQRTHENCIVAAEPMAESRIHLN